MNHKKQIQVKLLFVCIGLFILLVIFFTRTLLKEEEKNEINYITSTEISKMLSIALYSEDEWREILGEDQEPYITYGQVLNILDTLGIYDLFQEEVGRGNRGVEIKKSDWIEIYDQIVQLYDLDHQIQKKEVLILGTRKDIESLAEDETYTNQGNFTYKNIPLDEYKNQLLTVISRNNEIISIISIIDKEVILENTWIAKTTEKGFQIFSNGYYLDFVDEYLDQEYTNVIADIKIESGHVTKVRIKEEKISGKILAIHENGIEIDGYGMVPISDNFKVYKAYGELEELSISDLLVGYELVEFVVGEGKICAGLIVRSLTMENIRVLIKDTKESDLFHNELLLTSTSNFTLYYGTNQEHKEEHLAGEVVTINFESDYWIESRIKILPDTLSGQIIIQSIERQSGIPSYRGSMEVFKDAKGLVLINDVLIEEYLYSVLPSEMPESYGLEALKAQAVCARSYAYNQLLKNGYSEYGAHVDDSVQYQVYNNLNENPTSIQAVKDTYGQVMSYKDEVIEAYYFSTSCGHTTTCEVWNSEKINNMGYLQGLLVGSNSAKLDLTKEDNFRDFITNTGEDLFENKEDWFRWNTTISLKEIGDTINQKLSLRYKSNPTYILTKNADGIYESKPITTVGDVKEISIEKRLTGGVAHELIIKGTKATIKVITEYNIRTLLSANDNDIIRQNASIVKGASILPSAYVFLDVVKTENGEDGIKFSGGGYGHGVGLSQNAAKIMSATGMVYSDILKFFYSKVEIINLYE